MATQAKLPILRRAGTQQLVVHPGWSSAAVVAKLNLILCTVYFDESNLFFYAVFWLERNSCFYFQLADMKIVKMSFSCQAKRIFQKKIGIQFLTCMVLILKFSVISL